jgi:hypothetical protein
MADHELTTEEAFRALTELFSNLPSAPKRRCRKFVLEWQDGEPIFRLSEMPSKLAPPRDEIEVAIDEVMVELFGPDPDGDEIVPQKLARLFPSPLGAAADNGVGATDL